jgi:anaerobic ribonucleoside-triphosphate reductase activating protein
VGTNGQTLYSVWMFIGQKMKISTIQADHKDGGPGVRSEVFFWGCKKSCPGCQNAWISDFKPRKVKPKDVILQLLKIGNPKLSISGGEPMEQSKSLAKLVKLHKRIFGDKSDILVFTGWTLKEVVADKYTSEIFEHIRYLVTEPWIQEQSYTIVEDTCVGSENQKAYKISLHPNVYEAYHGYSDYILEPVAVDSYGHLLLEKEKS